MRRAFGLLTVFLFLNLTLGSSELVCEKHGPESSSQSAEMPAHHHGQSEHADHTGQSGHHHHQSSPAPATAACCPAMASCGLTAVAEASQRARAFAVHEATPSDVTRALLSRVTAPETPPPRA